MGTSSVLFCKGVPVSSRLWSRGRDPSSWNSFDSQFFRRWASSTTRTFQWIRESSRTSCANPNKTKKMLSCIVPQLQETCYNIIKYDIINAYLSITIELSIYINMYIYMYTFINNYSGAHIKRRCRYIRTYNRTHILIRPYKHTVPNMQLLQLLY